MVKMLLVAKKVPAAKMDTARDAALKEMKQQLSAYVMEVDVSADGTYVRTESGRGPKPKTTKGKWEVVNEEGDVLKLKTTDEGDKKSDTITLTFKGDDEYGFEIDDPKFKEAPFKMPVMFKRVK